MRARKTPVKNAPTCIALAVFSAGLNLLRGHAGDQTKPSVVSSRRQRTICVLAVRRARREFVGIP